MCFCYLVQNELGNYCNLSPVMHDPPAEAIFYWNVLLNKPLMRYNGEEFSADYILEDDNLVVGLWKAGAEHGHWYLWKSVMTVDEYIMMGQPTDELDAAPAPAPAPAMKAMKAMKTMKAMKSMKVVIKPAAAVLSDGPAGGPLSASERRSIGTLVKELIQKEHTEKASLTQSHNCVYSRFYHRIRNRVLVFGYPGHVAKPYIEHALEQLGEK